MKTHGVAILGFGFMGQTHLYAYRTLPLYYGAAPLACRMKVVCTAHRNTAEAARELGGFERCTTDPSEAILAEDVDIVHVCTPNHEHFPALKLAMEAGKHIYVDKPVTANLDEAERVSGLLPAYRGVAQVALQYRFLPATLKARELAERGFVGPVTHFRGAYLHSGSVDPSRPVNWKSSAASGGGVVRDLGSHALDLLDWLAGPFTAVHCVTRIWADQRPVAGRPGERMTVDAEEAAAMLLLKADGAFGVVEASKIATGAEDELRFEIHGRHGALRFDLMQPNYLEIYDGRLPEGDLGGERGWQRIATVQKYPKPGGTFPSPKNSIGWLRGHVHSLWAFLTAVAAGSAPRPSLADGIRLQRTLEAALRSARTRSWVDLPA